MASHTAMPSNNHLLWVHYNAENMQASPNRPRIYSHVQTNYQAWKRREDIRVLRSSSVKRITHEWKQRTLRPKTDGVRQQASLVQTQYTTRSPAPETTSPLSLMGGGNSDPFHVYSITIGPEENNLMTLYRDYILPLVYHFRIGDKNLKELALRDWQDNVATLEERGTALGTLARYGSIATRGNPGMRPVALKYLCQSTRALRDKVSHNEDLEKTVGCLHMNMLFNAEIINGNVAGANVHGRMLLHVFKQQWKEQRLDYKILLYQLHNDLQFAARFLSRPIFDEGDWLPRVLKPLWDAAAPYMPVYPEEELDLAIEDEIVSYWFRKRRQMLKYEKIQNTDGESLPPLPMVTTSVMSLSFLFHSRMINYYLDSEEQAKCQGLTDTVKSHLYAHQALALASAQLLRWTNYSPQVMGVPVYDNCRLLNALWHTLDQCEALSAQDGGKKYLNARMWALYVGALVERGSPFDQARTNQQRFNKKLAGLAWSMHVFTWNDLKVILTGFLYEETITSQGSVWFEEMVLNYQLGEELERFLNDLSPASR